MITSQFLNFDRLIHTHARDIARVETRIRARDGRIGVKNWRRLLDRLELEERNLSIGLYDKTRLVGYVIAYALPSSTEQPPTVRIHDLALLKPYRFRLRTMLVQLQSLIDTFVPDASIVVFNLSERDCQKWSNTHHLQRQLGYTTNRPPSPAARDSGALCFSRCNESERARSHALPVPQSNWRCEVSGQQLNISCITDTRQWTALEPHWAEILRSTPEATVFQSFDYLRTWWRYFGLSDRLFILVIEHDSEIIGIAPLMRSPTRIYGRTFMKLGFIGAPWEVDRATFLFSRRPEECLDATLRYLADHRDKWSIFEMFEQPADSSRSAKLLSDFRKRKLLAATTSTSKCPYLSLSGTWQDYHASLPRKFRKNINRSRRLLEKSAPVSMQTISSWPELDNALSTHRAIERRSWKTKKELGIGRDSHYFGFYRELARRFGSQGNFVLRALKLGDESIASTFGLVFNQVFYSLMITHDQAHDRASPGTLLESLEMEECFDSELHEYDFLGGFLTNKLRWTSTVRDTQNLHFYQRAPQLRLLFMLHFVAKPRAREILRQLKLFDSIEKWRKRVQTLYTEHIGRPKTAEVRRASMAQNDQPARD